MFFKRFGGIALKYIMGVDQGGTKTDVVVSDIYGNIVGYGKGAGAYHVHDGTAAASAAVKKAADMAISKAGISSGDIIYLAAGMTGMDWPSDYPVLKKVLTDATGVTNMKIYNDSVIAMYGGTMKSSGAVLCAGTGLNVAARSLEGDELVLGFYIADQDQGGSALAERAIQKVFFADIGLCGKTKLTQLFCNYAQTDNVEGLMYKYCTDRKFTSSIRFLVPDIIETARNDEVTYELIDEFAHDLSRYVYAGLNKFNMCDSDVDVVLSGSVLKGKDNLLTEKIVECVKKFAPNASVIRAKYAPVVGANILGLMSLDNFEDNKETILNNIQKSAVSLGLTRD